MVDHDHPYKRLFAQPALISDLIRLVFKDLAEELDFDSLDRRNTSFVSDDWREREDDIIWRLRWQGRDIYLYLLIEFQSSPDIDMPVRIMNYVSLLYQDIRRSGTIGSTDPLPPVLPLVLYNGTPPWQVALDIREAIGPVPSIIERFQPRQRYLLLDETRMELSPRAEERNLAAAVFKLEQTASLPDQLTVAQSIRAWLTATKRKETLDELLRWWTRNLAPRNDLPTHLNPFQEDPMLAERMHQWVMTVKAEGKAEGEAKGKAEGEAKGKVEGELDAIRRLHQSGILDTSKAITAIQTLITEGIVPEDMAQALIRELEAG